MKTIYSNNGFQVSANSSDEFFISSQNGSAQVRVMPHSNGVCVIAQHGRLEPGSLNGVPAFWAYPEKTVSQPRETRGMCVQYKLDEDTEAMARALLRLSFQGNVRSFSELTPQEKEIVDSPENFRKICDFAGVTREGCDD